MALTQQDIIATKKVKISNPKKDKKIFDKPEGFYDAFGELHMLKPGETKMIEVVDMEKSTVVR